VREVLFREAVLNFFGISSSPMAGKGFSSPSPLVGEGRVRGNKEKYCQACRKAKKDDCGNCKFKKSDLRP